MGLWSLMLLSIKAVALKQRIQPHIPIRPTTLRACSTIASQTCLELCNQRGYEAAGVAEDLDVSGAVDPFDRKKRPNLDLGDLYQITEERNVGGPVVEWQEILTAMAESRFRA